MDERDNVRTVRQLYACFGQGDIPGALRLLADDVDWHVAGPSELEIRGRITRPKLLPAATLLRPRSIVKGQGTGGGEPCLRSRSF